MAEKETKKTTRKASAAKAEETPKATETVTETPAPKTFTEDEVKALIAEAIAQVKSATPVSQNETVTVMFIAEVSPENVLVIPGYGSLRPTSTLDIPKQEFKGKFMMPLVRKLIDKRHLIVLDGLTKDERVRFNCDYNEGEVMTEKVFDHILEFDNEKLVEVFKLLCEEHKRFVCTKIITAYGNKSNHISIEKMQAVNKLTLDITPGGLLKPIIEDYGKKLAE